MNLPNNHLIRVQVPAADRYLRPLLERIQNGDIDPSFVITHTMSLDDAAKGYDIFVNKEDNCVKIVLKP